MNRRKHITEFVWSFSPLPLFPPVQGLFRALEQAFGTHVRLQGFGARLNFTAQTPKQQPAPHETQRPQLIGVGRNHIGLGLLAATFTEPLPAIRNDSVHGRSSNVLDQLKRHDPQRAFLRHSV
jgi:hypothetical protein